MPPSSGTRAIKRKRAQKDADDDSPAEIAMEVTREALEMLRETMTKLEGMMKDACHGCPDHLRTFQLDAMSIHGEIMGLHLAMISARASDENIERDAHSFQRKAFKLHQSVGRIQPQSVKPKVTTTRIKVKGRPRLHARDSDAAKEGHRRVNIGTQTEDEEKEPFEVVDVGTQATEFEPALPEVSASLNPESKIAKIPRFFLETLSGHRYEAFGVTEVSKAFQIGSCLADFMQKDALFRTEYPNTHGDLVKDLYNQYTKREDWNPLREDAIKKKWFGNSMELRYAHYALEVLEAWRAQRGTETDATATIKPLYWALQATEKQIAYAVRWIRYLKVKEPISVLIICMIAENTRRG